jgi:hypothetical protein
MDVCKVLDEFLYAESAALTGGLLASWLNGVRFEE